MAALFDTKIREYSQSFAPDWTKVNTTPWTKEQVNELILKEVGSNSIWPTRFLVMLKAYTDDEEIDLGNGTTWKRPANFQKQLPFGSRIGRVLAWGADAFTDMVRFPSGLICNIGDLVAFIRYENGYIDVSETPLTYVEDTKILFKINPDDVSKIFTGHQIGK